MDSAGVGPRRGLSGGASAQQRRWRPCAPPPPRPAPRGQGRGPTCVIAQAASAQTPGGAASCPTGGVWGAATELGPALSLTAPGPARRYYFKKVSDEFDCGVVFEEVREDEAVLPVFEEKIIGKVEKVD